MDIDKAKILEHLTNKFNEHRAKSNTVSMCICNVTMSLIELIQSGEFDKK